MSACFCHVSEGETCPTAEMRALTPSRLFVCGTAGLFFFIFSLAATSGAIAETLLWTGSDGGDWFTDADWGPSRRVPGASDDVMIDTYGPVITIGTSAKARELLIGTAPAAGTLVVQGGLQTDSVFLGAVSGASGTASFIGAKWQNDGDVSIGGSGVGNLSLLHGTTASSKNVLVGGSGTGNGSLKLDNSSTLTNSDTVFVSGSSSGAGGGGNLEVLGASELYSARGVLAEDLGTTGTALVSGEDSHWTMSGDMVVGEAGVGKLTVTGGGTVISQTTTVIANLASADGSSVTVSRLGSSLQSGGSLVVGNSGAATLLVEAAGTVTSGEAIVGRHSASEATVTGDGSNWRRKSVV